MSCAIRTQNLSKRFRSAEAVRDLTLEVPRGSIFAFLGPNGAGKTTTIKTLMNIFPPSTGSATVLDTDSRRLGPRQFERLGYVSENQQLPLWMRLDYFFDYCRGFYPSWDDEFAGRLIGRFDLPRRQKLKHLSRGMRMKAALISSIAYRPELLVLDEPFSGLDPVVRDDLISGILELSAEQEWTVFVSSHDLAEIENLASHVGYIQDGRLRFAEEIGVVQARFREIELTCDTPPDVSTAWPQGWTKAESSGSLVRFVVTNYSEPETPKQIERLFPGCRSVTASPMSLRAIFTNLAKSKS